MNERNASRGAASHQALRRTTVLAWALLVGLLPVQAARVDSMAGEGLERNSPVGVWLTTVVRPAPLPPLLSMETYFADGNSLEESNSTLIRSLGHGTWTRTGPRTFMRTALNFVFDSSRNFTGSTQRVQSFQLSQDGQTSVLLEGVAYRFDTAGNLVSTTPDVPGSATARRLFGDQK